MVNYNLKTGSRIQCLMDPTTTGTVAGKSSREGFFNIQYPGRRGRPQERHQVRLFQDPQIDENVEPTGCVVCLEVATVSKYSEPRLARAGTIYVEVHHEYHECVSCGVQSYGKDDHDHLDQARNKANSILGNPNGFRISPLSLVEEEWVQE
jgi:hypothetical protein